MLSAVSYLYAMYRPHIFWGVGIGCFLFGLSSLFKPIIIAIVLSYILNTPITRLERYHVPRPLSAICFIVILIAALVGFVMIIAPFMHDNMILLSQKIPYLLDSIGDYIRSFSHRVILRFDHETVIKISRLVQEQMFTISQQVVVGVLGLIQRNIDIKNVFAYCIIMPFMVYCMSVDFTPMMRFFAGLISEEKRSKYQRIAMDLDQSFFLYFSRQGLVSSILMLGYMLGLYLIGIKYALMLGLLMGLLLFIPYVGFFFGFLMTLLVAFANHDPSWGLFVRVWSVFAILGLTEMQILSPRIIGKKMGIPPLVFILAIFVMNYYFGILGIFLASPITATLVKLWLERWHTERISR